MAQGCRKPRCFNCECPGHVASDCDLDPLCGICLKPDHPVVDCPYPIFSANLESVGNPVPVPSHADAARQNRPASPVAAHPVDSGRKRKADHESVRSATPKDTPVGDHCGSPERSAVRRGKVRWRERSTCEDHQPCMDRGRDTAIVTLTTMRTVINEKNAMRITVWREITVEKVRGVVKGTACGSAPHATAGEFTIGAVVPIADATAINHRRCFPVIPTQMKSIDTVTLEVVIVVNC